MSSLSTPLRAPYRSEAFAEDLFDATEGDDNASLPWTWAQAGLAVLLCAVPVALAVLGGAVGLLSGQA
jgi:hypothetical protein